MRARRDLVAASALFLATAAFVLWQNSQVAILWDLGYLLDTSWRIALGQMPYRDFPLVHAPLTFLIQTAIIQAGGRHYLLLESYTALVGGLGTLLAWRILLRILARISSAAWTLSLLLALPLVFLGIYGIYPHPIYDCDCGLSILIALFLLQRLESAKLVAFGRWAFPLLTGAAVVFPAFFKQNMGVPFALAVGCGLVLLLAVKILSRRAASVPEAGTLATVLGGMALALGVALALIQHTAGLGNYLRWTVRFAAERRLPGFADMLGVYRQPSFLWTLPAVGVGLLLLLRLGPSFWARVAGFCLLAAPFVWSLVFLFLDDDLDERADNLLALWPLVLVVSAMMALFALRKGLTLACLFPFFVLAAIHGSFLSQQLWGSTYAIWPLLMLLIAQSIAALPAHSSWVRPALAGVTSATLAVCGGLYAAGHERLNYAHVDDGAMSRSTLPALHAIATPGPYLANFDELARFAAAEIPTGDALLLLPGEDPFYYATGRTPRFPVSIFDRTTDPYSPSELLAEARRRNVRWVIVKTVLQSNEDPLPQRDETLTLVVREFPLARHLAGYDIYRRPQ